MKTFRQHKGIFFASIITLGMISANLAYAQMQGPGRPGNGQNDGRPGDGRPGDGRPGDGRPGDGRPGDGRPGDGRPGDGRPGDGQNDGRPGDFHPGPGPGPDDNYRHAEQVVDLMYRAFLFRNADPGAQGWVDVIARSGMAGVIQVAQAIANSPEYASNIRGRVNDWSIVVNIYQVFFNRNADQSAAGWVNLLNQGNTAQAFVGIVSSQEFQEKVMRRDGH